MAKSKTAKIIQKGKKKKLKIDIKTIKNVAKARIKQKKKSAKKSMH